MAQHVRTLLSKDDLHAIAAAIGEAEQKTSGEIRVSVRQRRSRRERGLEAEAVARHEFSALGMARKKLGTGVLIFLLVEDRQFVVLADEGIHSKVQDGTWQKIADEMSSHFSGRRFREGIIHGVHAVGRVLAARFPRSADDRNELPDNVRLK